MAQPISSAASEGAIGGESGQTGPVTAEEQKSLPQNHAADAGGHAKAHQDSPTGIAPSPAAAEQPQTDVHAGNAILEAMHLAGHNLALLVSSQISAEEPGLARQVGQAAHEGFIPPSPPVLASQLETGSPGSGFSGETEPAPDNPTNAAAAAEEANEAEAKISINLQPRLEWHVNAEITLQQPDAASDPQKDEPVDKLDATYVHGSAASMGMESSHGKGVPVATLRLSEGPREAKAAG